VVKGLVEVEESGRVYNLLQKAPKDIFSYRGIK
jgi:hypothetical protein